MTVKRFAKGCCRLRTYKKGVNLIVRYQKGSCLSQFIFKEDGLFNEEAFLGMRLKKDVKTSFD